MNREPETPSTLSYARPRKAAQDAGKGALLAAILAVPGVAGFCLLAGALLFNSRLAWSTGPKAGLWIWIVAFLCAIISIYLFQSKSQPWWVLVCVVINMIGVIFTLSPFGWLVAAMLYTEIFKSNPSP
jgi:hypothetical protein